MTTRELTAMVNTIFGNVFEGPVPVPQETPETLESAQTARTVALHTCLIAEMQQLMHFPTLQLRHVPEAEIQDFSAPMIRRASQKSRMREALHSMALHSCLLAEIRELIHFPTFQFRHVKAELIRDRSQPVIKPGIMLRRLRTRRKSREDELVFSDASKVAPPGAVISPSSKRQRTTLHDNYIPTATMQRWMQNPKSLPDFIPNGWLHYALCAQINSHPELRQVARQEIRDRSAPVVSKGVTLLRWPLPTVLRELLNKAPSAHFFLQPTRSNDRSAPKIDAGVHVARSLRRQTLQMAAILGSHRTLRAELRQLMFEPLVDPKATRVTLRHLEEHQRNDRSAPAIYPVTIGQNHHGQLLTELSQSPPHLRSTRVMHDCSAPALDPKVHVKEGSSPLKAAMKTAAALGARRCISAEIEQLFHTNPEHFLLRHVAEEELHDCSAPVIEKGVAIARKDIHKMLMSELLTKAQEGRNSKNYAVRWAQVLTRDVKTNDRSAPNIAGDVCVLPTVRPKVVQEVCALAARHLTMVNLSRKSVDCEVPKLRSVASLDRSAPRLEKGTSYHPNHLPEILQEIKQTSLESLRHVDEKECHDVSKPKMDKSVHIKQDFAHKKLLRDLRSISLPLQTCSAQVYQEGGQEQFEAPHSSIL